MGGVCVLFAVHVQARAAEGHCLLNAEERKQAATKLGWVCLSDDVPCAAGWVGIAIFGAVWCLSLQVRQCQVL